jgi:hypothetical protein
LHERDKTEVFARAIEVSIQSIDDKATELISNKQEVIQNKLYDSLRTELASKEFVRAEVGVVRAELAEVRVEMTELRAEVRQNTLLLKVLIGIAVFGLTLANPAFVELIKKIF